MTDDNTGKDDNNHNPAKLLNCITYNKNVKTSEKQQLFKKLFNFGGKPDKESHIILAQVNIRERSLGGFMMKADLCVQLTEPDIYDNTT